MPSAGPGLWDQVPSDNGVPYSFPQSWNCVRNYVTTSTQHRWSTDSSSSAPGMSLDDSDDDTNVELPATPTKTLTRRTSVPKSLVIPYPARKDSLTGSSPGTPILQVTPAAPPSPLAPNFSLPSAGPALSRSYGTWPPKKPRSRSERPPSISSLPDVPEEQRPSISSRPRLIQTQTLGIPFTPSRPNFRRAVTSDELFVKPRTASPPKLFTKSPTLCQTPLLPPPGLCPAKPARPGLARSAASQSRLLPSPSLAPRPQRPGFGRSATAIQPPTTSTFILTSKSLPAPPPDKPLPNPPVRSLRFQHPRPDSPLVAHTLATRPRRPGVGRCVTAPTSGNVPTLSSFQGAPRCRRHPDIVFPNNSTAPTTPGAGGMAATPEEVSYFSDDSDDEDGKKFHLGVKFRLKSRNRANSCSDQKKTTTTGLLNKALHMVHFDHE